VHKYFRTLMGTAAVAALGAAVMLTNAHFARAQDAPQKDASKKEKALKDTQEYDLYNAVILDANANPPNGKKLLTDLDTWTQKYPATDYKAERTYYYLQGYASANQPEKALDVVKELVGGPLDALKADPKSAGLALRALYLAASVATTAASTGNPTPEELDTGSQAARMLLDYANDFFAPAKKPADKTDALWAEGKKQTQDAANGALLQIALYPGVSILKKNSKDPATCAQAEPAFVKALQQYPDSGQVTLQLANVYFCQRATSEKLQQALYEYARAVGLPVGLPFGLDAPNQKTFDDFLKSTYIRLHGSEDGLAQVREVAMKDPLPPKDFKIETAGEIALRRQQEFAQKNPQLAMWMGIKGQLASDAGQQYFDGSMKDSDVKGPGGTRALKGTLVGAQLKGKPQACHPDELLVAVPMPDQTAAPVAEIKLKLVDEAGKSKPLTDKPDMGIEIQFDGVPKEFNKDPFLLTMEADKSEIDGLKGTPCTVAPPAKKGAPAPKKKG